MATGDAQRNMIVKSEQGLIFFAETFYFDFHFVSSLFRFVSVSEEYRFVSFHEFEIYFPFRFVSENYAFLAFRSISFRFVPKPWYLLTHVSDIVRCHKESYFVGFSFQC
jgi:hypothetical protein